MLPVTKRNPTLWLKKTPGLEDVQNLCPTHPLLAKIVAGDASNPLPHILAALQVGLVA
jgi:hypothetical protein